MGTLMEDVGGAHSATPSHRFSNECHERFGNSSGSGISGSIGSSSCSSVESGGGPEEAGACTAHAQECTALPSSTHMPNIALSKGAKAQEEELQTQPAHLQLSDGASRDHAAAPASAPFSQNGSGAAAPAAPAASHAQGEPATALHAPMAIAAQREPGAAAPAAATASHAQGEPGAAALAAPTASQPQGEPAASPDTPAWPAAPAASPQQDCLLADFFSDDSDSLIEAHIDELGEVANAEGLLVFVYAFSELQPGEQLHEHVQRLVASGSCPHPSQAATLRFVSERALQYTNAPDFAAARQVWGRFWTEQQGNEGGQNVWKTRCVITPLHQGQEWQAFLRNSLIGDYGRFCMSGITPGEKGKRPSSLWAIHTLPLVVVDSNGTRFWGMIRQAWPCTKAFQDRWALRDVHAKKLTLFCCTYVSAETGAILSQNHTSMSLFGLHAAYNAETGLSRRGTPRQHAGMAAQRTLAVQDRGCRPSSANFLGMLFDGCKDELDKLRTTVTSTVYRIDGLEIVHPELRAWMGVPQGVEVFHDVQIVANQDPITQEQVYAISQIDVTDRVLAKRELQQAHTDLAFDKARMAVLVNRQYDLIACLGKVNDMGKNMASNAVASSMVHNFRRQILESSDLLASAAAACAMEEGIQKLELLGEGSFGSVYKAIWNGQVVAVKSLFLPISMSAGKKREAMALMEAAISSSLVHDHIVQTYTYRLQPVRQQQTVSSSGAPLGGCGLGGASGVGGGAGSHVASPNRNRTRSVPGPAPATAGCSTSLYRLSAELPVGVGAGGTDLYQRSNLHRLSSDTGVSTVQYGAGAASAGAGSSAGAGWASPQLHRLSCDAALPVARAGARACADAGAAPSLHRLSNDAAPGAAGAGAAASATAGDASCVPQQQASDMAAPAPAIAGADVAAAASSTGTTLTAPLFRLGSASAPVLDVGFAGGASGVASPSLSAAERAGTGIGDVIAGADGGIGSPLGSSGSPGVITGFEVQLVLELCDCGTLRRALDAGVLCTPSGDLDYASVLETAMEIAKGMAHLHSLGITHSDLKPHNVLLQSTDSPSNRRGFCAKIADFGLSLQTDATSPPHMPAGLGTAPYIAPELWANRVHSPAADVYAYGITLWELLTGGTPCSGVPLMMVAQQVVANHLRPSFPQSAPEGYVELARRCWDADAAVRPSFDEIVGCLERLARDAQLAPPQLPFPSLHSPHSSDLGSSHGDGVAVAAMDGSEAYSLTGSPGSGGGGGTPPMLLLPTVDSPAERMLLLLEQLMCGEEVNMSEVMQLHRTILTLRDVRQPVNLAKKLQSMNFDADVCRSLLLLLSTPETRADPTSAGPSTAARPRGLDPVNEDDGQGGGFVAEGVRSCKQACQEADVQGLETNVDDDVERRTSNVEGIRDRGQASVGPSSVALSLKRKDEAEAEGQAMARQAASGCSALESGAVAPLSPVTTLIEPESTSSACTTDRASTSTCTSSPASTPTPMLAFNNSLVRRGHGCGSGGGGMIDRSYCTTSDRSLCTTSGTATCTSASTPEEILWLYKQPRDVVATVLAKTGAWQFDAFELAEVSGGRPLSMLAFAVIRRCNSGPTRALVSEQELVTYLRHVEDGYSSDVPYHNSTHAADVLHSMYTLLTTGGVLKTAWNADPDLLLLAALFAAVIHDFEHVGLNNDYLIKSRDELALRYNDRSPMENHHLAAAFALLQRPDCNFLSSLPEKSLATLRRQVIEMVLATDMKQHFAMVSLFNTKFGPPAASAAAAAAAAAGAGGNGGGSKSGASASTSLLARRNSLSAQDTAALGLDDDTLSLVLQLALKCADLGSLGAARDVNRKWVSMLEEEMFLQGDRERLAGLPISPLMDRHCPKGGVSRSQTGFFRVVALPMFETFVSVFPGTKPILQHVNENYAWWQAEGK